MDADSYRAGVSLTFDVVGRFKVFGSGRPEFVFPEGGAVIAGVDQLGKYLARNAAAHELLAELVAEAKRRRQEEPPTLMMLQAVLHAAGIAYKEVPFDQLGLPPSEVQLIQRGGGSA